MPASAMRGEARLATQVASALARRAGADLGLAELCVPGLRSSVCCTAAAATIGIKIFQKNMEKKIFFRRFPKKMEK